MSSLKKQLGARIRELRKARGITQEALAEMLGIGTANISYIENGKFAPSFENFEKMINVFDVEPYELYKFPNRGNIDDIRKELTRVINSDEDMLMLIYRFYKSFK